MKRATAPAGGGRRAWGGMKQADHRLPPPLLDEPELPPAPEVPEGALPPGLVEAVLPAAPPLPVPAELPAPDELLPEELLPELPLPDELLPEEPLEPELLSFLPRWSCAMVRCCSTMGVTFCTCALSSGSLTFFCALVSIW